jgi:ATP-dependent Lon protease
MLQRFIVILFFALAICASPQAANAQVADNKGVILPKTEEEDSDKPKSFRETLEKLRIEKEKKDYAEMLERGAEALRLTEELEKAYAKSGRLDSSEMNKLVSVEKLVKKIRNELGGDDEDGDENERIAAPLEKGAVIQTFRSTTVKLLDELKKTTRFTVSAAAIQASNAVLKIAKMLRISR